MKLHIICCELENIQYYFKTKNLSQGAIKTEMSQRHHTATNRLKPKHTSMIYTSLGMWSICPT